MTHLTSKRVVVAMSGGVDSSVAALLLKQQGYEVIGISLKLWDYNEAERDSHSRTCCSSKDILDARQVSDLLGIPFYAFNYKKEFEQNVIKTFASEYYEGRTPNPCILCNQHIKFDRLLDEAQKLGADYLATGHYARLQKDEGGTYHLLKGKDSHKDQSYVLYGLGQEILKKVLLPIGDYTKEEIRQIAGDAGLVTAHKPESQDICFIPTRNHADFINKHYPLTEPKKGLFVDKTGGTLGEHEGIHAYTTGQRRGLGISTGERLYVTRIDPKKNSVELGTRAETYREGFRASKVQWIVSPTHKRVECGVKIRYQKDEIPAVVERHPEDGQATIYFKSKHFGVSPGQAAVFYRGDEVLGGGLIDWVL